MTHTPPPEAESSALPATLPFDDFAQEIYLEEIQRHCARGLRAARRMENAITVLLQGQTNPGHGLTQRETQRVHENAFDNAEAVISETAMVAQLLWPDPRKGPGETKSAFKRRVAYAAQRGSKLRQVLDIGPNSPLQARALRNSIEHFDERLDQVTMDPPRVILRGNMGPIDIVGGMDGLTGMHLHHLDPMDGRYTIMGDSVILPEVTQALQTLIHRVEQLLVQMNAHRWSSAGRAAPKAVLASRCGTA